MKKYYQLMLGRKSIFAEECYNNNFIGVDFLSNIDLTVKLPDDWRKFNQRYIPVYLEEQPYKTRVAAGLGCGALWTVVMGINIGDIVLCPNGSGSYYAGEVLDSYSFHSGKILPHRRTVKWYPKIIERTNMSETLKSSTGSIGTVVDISKYSNEIEKLFSLSQ